MERTEEKGILDAAMAWAKAAQRLEYAGSLPGPERTHEAQRERRRGKELLRRRDLFTAIMRTEECKQEGDGLAWGPGQY